MPRFQFIQTNVAPERGIQMHFDARTVLEHPVHVFFDDARRQAESGYTPHHHAAQAVGHFVYMNFKPSFGQILRGGEARRARAHDRDGFFARYRHGG